ncbi:MAG: hypothetical protein NT062_12560 [Proteobacteria bacterium]|nr:hypothetical protein [Pseudomonadota bacterium]
MNKKSDDRALEVLDLDALDEVSGAGREVGTYASVNRSYGIFTVSTTTYTDGAGNSFQGVTTGWGASVPGWSASAGKVYANDDNPTASLRDVALGPSWSGGLLDQTSVNGTGYTLELATTNPLQASLERTNTTEIPGTATSAPQPTTQTFDDGSTLTTHTDGTTTATNAPADPQSSTQSFDDGSTLTTHPDGTTTSTDATDHAPATGTGEAPHDGAQETSAPNDGGSNEHAPDDGNAGHDADGGAGGADHSASGEGASDTSAAGDAGGGDHGGADTSGGGGDYGGGDYGGGDTGGDTGGGASGGGDYGGGDYGGGSE